MSDYGPAGRELYDGLTAVQDDGRRLIFTAAELVLVSELCRLADDIEAIRQVLEGRDWLIPGSKGQEVVDPLRGELHRTSTRFEQIVKTLSIPDDVPEELSPAWAGRKLARARWS